MLRISIFDMDRTITRSGTYSLWLKHWVRARAPWRTAMLPLVGIAGMGFLAGAYDRGRLKAANQTMLMGKRVDAGIVEREAAVFAQDILARHCHADALRRLQSERAEGRRVMIATASFDYYVHALSRLFRAEDVIATRCERDAGDLLARLNGPNCYGEDKLAQIESYFEARGIDRSECHVRFFTDHHSDLPTLKWSDEAITVNPDKKLKAAAQEKGWPVLHWS